MSRAKRHSISIAILVVAIGISVGPQIASLDEWRGGATPAFVGNLIGTVCGVFMAWLTRRPRAPRDENFANRYLRGPEDR